MAIKWYNEKQKDCIATISDTSITFNKPTIMHLEYAYKVMLGIDDESHQVVLKPLSKDEYEQGVYKDFEVYNLSIRSSFARVTNKGFVSEIKRVIKVESLKENPKKFVCQFDEEKNVLLITLDKEI